jgi:hypothetical protein
MRGRIVQLAAALAALDGCADARVNVFTASSEHICAGDLVELAWNVTGSGTMKVTPALAGAPDGHVDDVGGATIAPTQPTNVELHVTRFLANPTTSVRQIRMERPEPLTASLGDADASPGCAAGKIFATVHAKRFTPDIKVTTVTSRAEDDRSYEVDHGGLHATVQAGVVVTSFKGLPIEGDWSLSTPLRPGETCQTTTLASLGIQVFTECPTGRKP